MTDTDKIALLARVVMGWVADPKQPGNWLVSGTLRCGVFCTAWNPITNDADTLQVVRRMQELGRHWSVSGNTEWCRVSFSRWIGSATETAPAVAGTFGLAVCNAALAAVGEAIP